MRWGGSPIIGKVQLKRKPPPKIKMRDHKAVRESTQKKGGGDGTPVGLLRSSGTGLRSKRQGCQRYAALLIQWGRKLREGGSAKNGG